MAKRTQLERRVIYTFYKKYGIKQTCISFNLSYDTVRGIASRMRAKSKALGPEYLVQLRAKAISYGRLKLGTRAEVEDFASFCIEHSLQQCAPVKLAYALPNFIRETVGVATDSGPCKLRNSEHRFSVQIEDMDDVQVPEPDHVRLTNMANDLGLVGYDRAWFMLTLNYGMSNDEVCSILGVDQDTLATISKSVCDMIAREYGYTRTIQTDVCVTHPKEA